MIHINGAIDHVQRVEQFLQLSENRLAVSKKLQKNKYGGEMASTWMLKIMDALPWSPVTR